MKNFSKNTCQIYNKKVVNIGLVVAVNGKFEDEIVSNLERYKINDYITPYWITKDMIYSS